MDIQKSGTKNGYLKAAIAAPACGGALFLLYYTFEYAAAQTEIAAYETVRSGCTLTERDTDQRQGAGGDPDETDGLPYTVVDFDELLKANPETVGWIAISGTKISYPVTQAKDNDKYLRTSFNGGSV